MTDGLNRKERRHLAKCLAAGEGGEGGAAAGGGGGVRAVAHGDFNEAFLHTEGQAGLASKALNEWKDRVMLSQVYHIYIII